MPSSATSAIKRRSSDFHEKKDIFISGKCPAMMGSNAATRLGRLCSLLSLFVRPPKLLRTFAEGAAKMSGEVGLIGKAGFIGAKVASSQVASKSTAHKVLMRRYADERVEEPAEMERTQAGHARHLLTGHP